MRNQECCVLIPSLSPDQRLPDYVKALLKAGFGGVVVVNDGSAAEYNGFFDQCAAMEGCSVIGYPANHGKGYALRCGIRYIRENTGFTGIITADSDGQHTPADTEKMAAAMDGSAKYWLGSRDFTGRNKNIPTKSRLGNRITSVVFKLFYGPYLPDTQTGLRAFPMALCTYMEGIGGDRFEYEMNTLIHCSEDKISMAVVPIETVYLNENKSSHFHPFRDSWRIYKLILGNFIRYMGSSLLCWAIDYGLWALLYYLLFTRVMPEEKQLFSFSLAYLCAKVSARVVSSLLNFFLNRKYVFEKEKCKGAMLRYYILVVLALAVSALTGSFLTGLMPKLAWLFTLIVDIAIYFINYRVQKAWVFREQGNTKEDKQ